MKYRVFYSIRKMYVHMYLNAIGSFILVIQVLYTAFYKALLNHLAFASYQLHSLSNVLWNFVQATTQWISR